MPGQDNCVHCCDGPVMWHWGQGSFLLFADKPFSIAGPQHIANYICGIQTVGHRVVVSDVQESFIWVRYKRNENQLIIFADDTHPRWVTTACLLDYDTVAGADKFGNICVVSWPKSTYVAKCPISFSGPVRHQHAGEIASLLLCNL